MQEDAWCQRDDIEEHLVRLFGCIFAWGTRLTRARTKEVEEKVRAIGSELPVFGAVMTKHIVSCSNDALVSSTHWFPQNLRIFLMSFIQFTLHCTALTCLNRVIFSSFFPLDCN